MTRRLESVLGIEPMKEKKPIIPSKNSIPSQPPINLEEKLEEFDKISSALPRVKGLGDISDIELDALAIKAEEAYDNLMDLGMNVEARYGSKMFEVAATFLGAAITAKSAKIDKKLKMVELQLKKLGIDKKHKDDPQEINGEGFIMTDRNSILEKLKNLK